MLDWPPNRKWSGGKLVFRPSTGWGTPVSPIDVVIVKFAHAISRVLKRMKIWAGGGATFGAGDTAPFVTSPPVVGSRAPTLLSRGGRDRRILAASSIPQGIRGLYHGRGCRVVASSSVSRMEGGRRTRNMAKKRSLSGETQGGRCCFRFPVRTLGLRPFISMGRRRSSK